MFIKSYAYTMTRNSGILIYVHQQTCTSKKCTIHNSQKLSNNSRNNKMQSISKVEYYAAMKKTHCFSTKMKKFYKHKVGQKKSYTKKYIQYVPSEQLQKEEN